MLLLPDPNFHSSLIDNSLSLLLIAAVFDYFSIGLAQMRYHADITRLDSLSMLELCNETFVIDMTYILSFDASESKISSAVYKHSSA